MRVVVLAPIDNSPFAQAICKRCLAEPGVELSGIVVRTILNPQRLRSELRRDGIWLLRKIWKKLVLASDDASTRDQDGFFEVAVREGARDEGLSQLARRRGIPLARVADHNDPESVALLAEAAPDAVAFTGGGIIRKPLLEVSGHGIFNTHMGSLPAYRGMDVVEWPLIEIPDEPHIGVTLHFMASGIDTGPIARVQRVEIQAGDSMERLRKRFEPVMADLLMHGIRAVRDGTLELQPQQAFEGRQYFVMHPRFYAVARRELARHAGEPS